MKITDHKLSEGIALTFRVPEGNIKHPFDYLMPWVMRYQECSAPLLCECLHRSRIRNDYF